MYLIPKNIKIKKEIFKGFGILEIIAMSFSFTIGYILSSLFHSFKIKIFLFSFFPLLMFLLLLPLPNGSTVLKILKKYIIYIKRQKRYKTK